MKGRGQLAESRGIQLAAARASNRRITTALLSLRQGKEETYWESLDGEICNRVAEIVQGPR